MESLFNKLFSKNRKNNPQRDYSENDSITSKNAQKNPQVVGRSESTAARPRTNKQASTKKTGRRTMSDRSRNNSITSTDGEGADLRKTRNNSLLKEPIVATATTTTAATAPAPRRPPSSNSLPPSERPLSVPLSEFLATKESRAPAEFAQYWFELMNRHDLDSVAQLCAPDCALVFVQDELTITVEDFVREVRALFVAFPDFSFVVDDCHGLTATSARLGYIQARGTHTDAPYGFGPFPAIPAAGVEVANDPECSTITIRDGLVVIHEFRCSKPHSDKTGMAGIYRQIGGFPF